MKFNISIWWLILSVLTILLLSIFIGNFVYSTHCGNKDGLHKNQIDIIKQGKDSVIQQNYHTIHSLTLSLDRINETLDEYEHKLDSLEIADEKVKIIYKTIYKDIEIMSDSGQVSYWKEQFNDE